MTDTSLRTTHVRVASLCLAVLSLLLVLSVTLPARAGAVDSSYTFTGTGYGHGLGLSQLGAVEAAKRGLTAEQIVKHYYTNVALTNVATYRAIVNVWSGASSGDKAKASWKVRPGYAGASLIIDNQTFPDNIYTFKAIAGAITMSWVEGGVVRTQTYDGTVSVKSAGQPAGQPGLVQVVDASGGLNRSNVRYRGFLYVVVPSGEPNEVTMRNYLDIEEYLYGVVPRELGSYFGPTAAASQAQAIVARSYAYPATSELYCTTKSQVYGGHSYFSSEANRSAGVPTMLEETASNAAVDATRGTHVSYAGSVVTTYFSASNGTATAQNEDIWGSTPRGYLRSVVDPYFVPTTSTSWTVNYTGYTLGAQLYSKGYGPAGAGSSISVDKVDLSYGAGGYAKQAVISWSNGSISTISPGQNVYLAFGLKSPQFKLNGGGGDTTSAVKRYEESVAQIQYAGSWAAASSAGASGGAIKTSSTSGASFSAKFTGGEIRWIGPKGPEYGQADVYIDGQFRGSTNLSDPTALPQQELFVASGLVASAEHEIKVVVSGSSPVVLDRLDVYGGGLKDVATAMTMLQETSAAVSRSSGWSTIKSSSMLGGAALYTSSLSKTLTVTFRGTDIRMYGYTSAIGGRAKVYVDGAYVKTINYKTSTTVLKKLLFYKGSLSATKTHTLKLVTIAKSGSTKAGRVTFDAVNISAYR